MLVYSRYKIKFHDCSEACSACISTGTSASTITLQVCFLKRVLSDGSSDKETNCVMHDPSFQSSCALFLRCFSPQRSILQSEHHHGPPPHLTRTYDAAFSSQLKSKVGNILAKAAALSVNLNIDGAPISSRSHTHPSYSQTSLLITSSLFLGVQVPRATQCM